MDTERQSNYEVMKHRMQEEFASRDMARIAGEWKLCRYDGALWTEFVSRTYRIDERTGLVTYDSCGKEIEADHNAAMTLFDILTRPRAAALGSYSPVQTFSKMVTSTASLSRLFGGYEKRFDHRDEALKEACRRLTGTEYGKGDVRMKIPVFRDLCVVLQFWDSDDEFGPSLSLLCDDSIMQFMHYETAMFMLFHLLQRIVEEMP